MTGAILTTHEHFMRLAISQALKAKKSACAPIGSVIVRNNVVIARAHNEKWVRHDATAHAEIQAIRKAGCMIGPDLDGCILYSTLQPCLMCLSASYWAHIEHICYGAGYEAGTKYFVTQNDTREEILQDMIARHIHIVGGICRQDCYELFR